MTSFLVAPVSASATPAAGAAATGDWTQFRNSPSLLGVNPAETALSPTTVSGLRQKWVNPVSTYAVGAPAVVNGVVYVGGYEDGKLHAIDAASGKELWAAPPDALPGDGLFSSPAVANGIVYIGINRPAASIWAFDATTGATLWNVGLSVSNIVGSPTVADGVVYATSTEDQVVALDAKTGTKIWDAKPQGGSSGFYSAPAVSGGLVFVTSLNHRVYALKADTGAVAWTFMTGAINTSSPAVSGGLVHFSSWDGYAYAVDAATGTQRWKVRLGTPSSEYSSPAVADGVVYIGSNSGRRVYALNAATGSQVWSARTGDTVLSSPVVANGVVYVGSYDGNVYGFAATNGRRLWSARLSSPASLGPVVSNGMVVVGTYPPNDPGQLFAFTL